MLRKLKPILAALLAVVTLLALPAVLAADEAPLLLSLEQLRQYDGKEGRPAYVAVDGVIYDMTDSIPWKNGEHNGFKAGNDLTREIKEISPHGVGKLQNVKAVGRVRVLLTLEELMAFDGRDGRPAYVAVDGIIYDMTASRAWKGGAHNGFQAGADLTKEIKERSPHGVGKLANVVEIGRLKVELTLEELKAFDGRDGRPAYVAVSGIIYDVTESAAWENGAHAGLQAGADVTVEAEASPHGIAVLDKVVQVGVLID